VLKAKCAPGVSIGFDVQVNDDDGGGQRDSKLAWNAVEDDAWQNTRAFGVAQPLGLVGWWKLDETDGRTAADSSGNGHDAIVQATRPGNRRPARSVAPSRWVATGTSSRWPMSPTSIAWVASL
jgi:hypothetical protein